MTSWRDFLVASGFAIAGVAAPRVQAAGPVEIQMLSSPRGEEVWFDPLGVYIERGQTVRWIMASPGNPHTTTAYHPRNANHSLRISETAIPWDSGFLVKPRDTFEVTLTVEGGGLPSPVSPPSSRTGSSGGAEPAQQGSCI